MKISQEEIDVANKMMHELAGSFDQRLCAALEAAYRVRKARKRVRQDAKLPSADDVRGILSRAESRNATPLTGGDDVADVRECPICGNFTRVSHETNQG